MDTSPLNFELLGLIPVCDVLTTLRLDEVKNRHVRSCDDGCIVVEDGKKTDIIAAAVTSKDGKITNPLAKLSADQIRRLRGVYLDAWEDTLDKVQIH